jgi:hypothetical protein
VKTLSVAAIVAGCIALIALLPFALVASLNMLFLTDIPYDFGSWLAALFLLAIVSGGRRSG